MTTRLTLTLVAVLAAVWCAPAVRAAERHFIERVLQSQRNQPEPRLQQRDRPRGNNRDDMFSRLSDQDQRRVRRPEADTVRPTTTRHRPRIDNFRMPPSLGDALAKALSYEANLSRLSPAQPPPATSSPAREDSWWNPMTSPDRHDSWRSPPGSRPTHKRLGPAMPSTLKDALATAQSTDAEDNRVTAEPEDPGQVKITESRTGCNCTGAGAVPERTLSFLISRLPPSQESLLELHLPVWGGARAAGPLAARLVLCAPGGAGRSVSASLLMKRARRRPGWTHAIVGDWLAVLRRPVSPAGECLQVLLPEHGGLRLDRYGGAAAELTARPFGSWRS